MQARRSRLCKRMQVPEERSVKVVKIIFGVLAAIYCVLQIVQLVAVLHAEKGVMRQSSVAAGAGLIVISGLVALICFRSAFK